MKKWICTTLSIVLFSNLWSQEYPYLKNETFTYEELIVRYQRLDLLHENAKLLTFRKTDSGKPLHLFVMSNQLNFEAKELATKEKVVVLINNGIHPGEPCGIDASMKLAEDLLNAPKTQNNLLDELVVCIVPVYNIGGMLNRNTSSRANQNGPMEYGFRGNARNYDLNRDFVKSDTENAKAFAHLFHKLKPHVFIDTHTSNGADYQATMTLITSQVDKANPVFKTYTEEALVPSLYKRMEKEGIKMAPYVNTIGKTPDTGIADFVESPRYSSGYTSLFDCIGFITEAHMLKPYPDRVIATHAFLKNALEQIANDGKTIVALKKEAQEHTKNSKWFEMNWQIDTTQVDKLKFEGYAAKYKKSEITGHDRLYYDVSAPYSKKIPHYKRCIPTLKVKKPDYFILPKAWQSIVERLSLNKVEMKTLSKDTALTAEVFYIEDFNTVDFPYEGHYLHRETTIRVDTQTMEFKEGDYVIPMNQYSNRFIMEVLDPRAVDSYFAWNFFDITLMQKEWFSAYVFEDNAKEIIEQQPDLKKQLEERRKKDASFAESHWQQLYFIYKNSPHYESSHRRYPVYRVFANGSNIPPTTH